LVRKPFIDKKAVLTLRTFLTPSCHTSRLCRENSLHPEFARKISLLRGPILVLGSSGFIGANLLKLILQIRDDAYGTAFATPSWRLQDVSNAKVFTVDLLVPQSARAVLEEIRPGTVFDCVAYGAYSFEKDPMRIYETNVLFKMRLIELLCELRTHCYIHAGSSSEYGEHADQPAEDSVLLPNSHYAVTKTSCAGLIHFAGKHRALRCANLRLYSVYGPLEEASRLIPSLVCAGLKGAYPPLVDPDVSRDFLYIDDACESFVDAALSLTPNFYGHSFNIGSGVSTTIKELALLSKEFFRMDTEPVFSSMPNRKWDFQGRWRALTDKAVNHLGSERAHLCVKGYLDSRIGIARCRTLSFTTGTPRDMRLIRMRAFPLSSRVIATILPFQ
jgi:dolichol-phosphate mannosyltransferase